MIETSNIPSGIHGGDPGASPYVFFRVDDIDAAAVRVRDLGGHTDEVDAEQRAVERARLVGVDEDDDDASTVRFGRFKLCRDDQGSSFGLHPTERLLTPTPQRAATA